MQAIEDPLEERKAFLRRAPELELEHKKELLKILARDKVLQMPYPFRANMLDYHGEPKITFPPTLIDADKMKHKPLIRILRYCPVSDYYGSSTRALKDKFTRKMAKQEVVKVIREWTDVLGMSSIAERSNEAYGSSRGEKEAKDQAHLAAH